MAKKNSIMGLPWWLWVGGGAALLYFVTRKAAAATIPGVDTPPAAVPAPPVQQVVDIEDPPMNEYVASPMNGCVGCL